jgi:hypothetical protein
VSVEDILWVFLPVLAFYWLDKILCRNTRYRTVTRSPGFKAFMLLLFVLVLGSLWLPMTCH